MHTTLSPVQPPSPATANTSRGLLSRRARAILAGGLVLGIGAAITLAAWNDSEFATGTFTSGQFNLVGSIDGVTFTENDVTPADVTFSTNFDNLSPDETVSAPFVVHLDAATTDNADLSVASAVGSGAAEAELTYGIVTVDAFVDCTPVAVGTATLVAPGTALDAVDATVPLPSVPVTQGVGAAPGADVFLCVQVTSSATLVQNTTAVGTWEFEAISN